MLHCLPLICVRNVSVLKDGKKIQQEQPTIHLLSCAPIEPAKDLSEFKEEIFVQFNTERYAKNFEPIFERFYKLDIREWAVCAVSDNAAINRKLTKL